MELGIRSHNYRIEDSARDYFAISFVVRSKLALSMDLGQVRLITSKGDRVAPHGFIMRIPRLDLNERIRCMSEHYYSRGDIKNYPTYKPLTATLYRITPQACYDLFFDIAPPKRGEGFYLDFQGLSSDTGPYPIPLIQFD
jgi:hypothetical protein